LDKEMLGMAGTMSSLLVTRRDRRNPCRSRFWIAQHATIFVGHTHTKPQKANEQMGVIELSTQFNLIQFATNGKTNYMRTHLSNDSISLSSRKWSRPGNAGNRSRDIVKGFSGSRKLAGEHSGEGASQTVIVRRRIQKLCEQTDHMV